MWLLWTILIGIVAGWLAGLVVKGRGMGILVDLIVGSLIGGFVAGLIGLAVCLRGGDRADKTTILG